MKYVLDASVALKRVLEEPDSDLADQLRGDRRSGVHEFIAPGIFPIEIAYTMTRAERQGRLPSKMRQHIRSNQGKSVTTSRDAQRRSW